MEEPVDIKNAIGEILKTLIKGRKDLADQIEDYKFDAAIGRFVREFEHIKRDMLEFICQCFISGGLHKTNDLMVKYLLKEMAVENIRQQLVPIYKFTNPDDETGHTGLDDFSKKIGVINSNRNSLVHQYHMDLTGMSDSGRKFTLRTAISAKLSPEGPTAKSTIYRATAIDENIQYLKELRHWMEQCSQRITLRLAIFDLLHEFNQRPPPTMGETKTFTP